MLDAICNIQQLDGTQNDMQSFELTSRSVQTKLDAFCDKLFDF